VLLELEDWVRRRVRLYYWKQWKRPGTRRRHLMALGISKERVKLASRSRKGLPTSMEARVVVRLRLAPALADEWEQRRAIRANKRVVEGTRGSGHESQVDCDSLP